MPIDVEVSGAIATMTLNRPEKLNALDQDMRLEMEDKLKFIEKNQRVRCLILTGAGKAFCAGGDVTTMGPKSTTSIRDRLKQQHRVTLSLFNLEKPVVVAVNGPAIGVGFNIALLADFILASQTAVFSQRHANVGIIPDGGGLYLLSRIVGLQKAKELVLTAETIDAYTAHRLGIVKEVYHPDELLNRAMELAEKLASGPTRAYGLDKALLNRSMGIEFESFLELEALGEAYIMNTKDHEEAVNSFKEKRDSHFIGE